MPVRHAGPRTAGTAARGVAGVGKHRGSGGAGERRFCGTGRPVGAGWDGAARAGGLSRQPILDAAVDFVETVRDALHQDLQVHLRAEHGRQDHLRRLAHGIQRIALARPAVFPSRGLYPRGACGRVAAKATVTLPLLDLGGAL